MAAVSFGSATTTMTLPNGQTPPNQEVPVYPYVLRRTTLEVSVVLKDFVDITGQYTPPLSSDQPAPQEDEMTENLRDFGIEILEACLNRERTPGVEDVQRWMRKLAYDILVDFNGEPLIQGDSFEVPILAGGLVWKESMLNRYLQAAVKFPELIDKSLVETLVPKRHDHALAMIKLVLKVNGAILVLPAARAASATAAPAAAANSDVVDGMWITTCQTLFASALKRKQVARQLKVLRAIKQVTTRTIADGNRIIERERDQTIQENRAYHVAVNIRFDAVERNHRRNMDRANDRIAEQGRELNRVQAEVAHLRSAYAGLVNQFSNLRVEYGRQTERADELEHRFSQSLNDVGGGGGSFCLIM